MNNLNYVVLAIWDFWSVQMILDQTLSNRIPAQVRIP